MHDIRTLFDIRLPVIQAPMAGSQDSTLALAVCQAGGLGSLPAAMLTPEGLAQELAVLRYTALRDAVSPAERELFDDFLDYAVRHHAVIARFGRFPHRNAILGRASSVEEAAFLKEPGSRF
eukprot:gene14582-17807_t